MYFSQSQATLFLPFPHKSWHIPATDVKGKWPWVEESLMQ